MQMREISFLLFFPKESYECFHFKTDNGRLQCRLRQIWDVILKHNNKTRTESQLGMIFILKSYSSFPLKTGEMSLTFTYFYVPIILPYLNSVHSLFLHSFILEFIH